MNPNRDRLAKQGSCRLGRPVVRPLAAEVVGSSFQRLDAATMADLCWQAENLGACDASAASSDGRI